MRTLRRLRPCTIPCGRTARRPCLLLMWARRRSGRSPIHALSQCRVSSPWTALCQSLGNQGSRRLLRQGLPTRRPPSPLPAPLSPHTAIPMRHCRPTHRRHPSWHLLLEWRSWRRQLCARWACVVGWTPRQLTHCKRGGMVSVRRSQGQGRRSRVVCRPPRRLHPRLPSMLRGVWATPWMLARAAREWWRRA